MSLKEEQCNKVCRILDDVLANRPTERDTLIVATRSAFRALSEPHWIPCSDRLPEEEGDYLVTVDPDYVPQGYRSTDVITWHNGKWIMADYFVLDGENRKKPEYKVIDFAMPIIAWMPLPEPYKGVTT